MPRTTTLGSLSPRTANTGKNPSIVSIRIESKRGFGFWDPSMAVSAKNVQKLAEKYGCLGLIVAHCRNSLVARINGSPMGVVCFLAAYCEMYEQNPVKSFNEAVENIPNERIAPLTMHRRSVSPVLSYSV